MIRRGSRRYIGRPMNSFWKLFSDYSETSTIHGIRYLGEKKRHWIERIWWMFVVIISTIACSGFILRAWTKMQTEPVIISFAEEAIPISNIPFPTITICSVSKVRASIFNYTKIWNLLETRNFSDIDLSNETIQKFNALSKICTPPEYLEEYIEHKHIKIDRNILPYLEEVSPTIFEDGVCYLAAGTWQCVELFSEILTDTGLCYTFNQMSSMDVYRSNVLADDFPMVGNFEISETLSVEFIRNESSSNLSYPYRVHIAGKGVEFGMGVPRNDSDFDFVCGESTEGLKIQIHSADEVPRLKNQFYHIPFDHDTRIIVRPNIMSTTKSLIENYTKKQRKCVSDADNENDLIFFKKYTQKNCQLETLAIEANATCGCVKFWMPRKNDTKICSSFVALRCIKRVESSIYYANLTSKCLPACNSISYDAEVSVSKMDRNTLDYRSYVGSKYVQISITFKDQQYYSTLRSERYSKLDFIAACGGILSLFMGVSILSVIEILYFATLRLSCNVRGKKAIEKRMQEIEKQQSDQHAVNFINCV